MTDPAMDRDGPTGDTHHLNLRTDLHGHAIEYASHLDRAWFAEHPDEDSYQRTAVEHEFCDPVAAAEGRCVPLITDAPVGADLIVEVTQFGVGARTRQPVAWVIPDVAES